MHIETAEIVVNGRKKIVNADDPRVAEYEASKKKPAPKSAPKKDAAAK